MKIVIKKVGEQAEIREVERLELEDMQELVGGYIEHVRIDLGESQVDMWLNEEGKLHGMLPNVALLDDHENIVDVVVGDVFFAGADEEGYTLGLSDRVCDMLPPLLNLFRCDVYDSSGAQYDVSMLPINCGII